MSFEVRVPRLGWSMETGVFVRWLKRDGEAVKIGEPLFELEGEKATQEIEAVDAGILRIASDAPSPGAEVAVGRLLATLVTSDEPVETRVTTLGQQSPADAAPAGPAARRLARELNVALDEVSGSGRGGRVMSGDVRGAVASPRRVASTPRARRMAADLGVDWKELHGTGRNGRIRERDVVGQASSPAATKGGSKSAASQSSSHRRTIARRMLASAQQTAAVTLTRRIDATNMVALRKQFKSAGAEIIPSYTDIVAKLVAISLARYPALAGRWEEERLVLPNANAINIGIAVDTEQGLLVPVLRGVSQATLGQVARESQRLISVARDGSLSADDMQHGVFTITNLGALGVEAFTPIINLPEVAILGLGAIVREAEVLDDDRIVPRDRMTLSLTFDHRAIDGAPAARFLQDLAVAIENPSACLLLP